MKGFTAPGSLHLLSDLQGVDLAWESERRPIERSDLGFLCLHERFKIASSTDTVCRADWYDRSSNERTLDGAAQPQTSPNPNTAETNRKETPKEPVRSNGFSRTAAGRP
jgi:hypothetical protein